MARLVLVCPVGVPQHIIQCGNNHQACLQTSKIVLLIFFGIKDYAAKFDVDVHARILMTNPVRANMVDDPSDYKWSSYQINALGKHHRYVLLINYI